MTKRRPSGIDGAGRTLYGRHGSHQRPPGVGDAEVRAAELVRRAEEHVGVDRADVDRLVRRVVHRVHPGERAGLVRDPAYPAASVTVPTAFDAHANATTLVRGPSLLSRSAKSSVVSSCSATCRTTRSLSCAISSHGATPASWSRQPPGSRRQGRRRVRRSGIARSSARSCSARRSPHAARRRGTWPPCARPPRGSARPGCWWRSPRPGSRSPPAAPARSPRPPHRGPACRRERRRTRNPAAARRTGP